jgi:clumping factor A
MTQKNTTQTANQTAKTKAGAGADAIVADVGINMDLEVDSQNSAMSDQPTTAQAETNLESAKGPNSAAVVHSSSPTTLSPEIIELVAELRDTVRSINPSRHTPKTLRRSLSNVRDILDDISALDIEH